MQTCYFVLYNISIEKYCWNFDVKIIIIRRMKLDIIHCNLIECHTCRRKLIRIEAFFIRWRKKFEQQEWASLILLFFNEVFLSSEYESSFILCQINNQDIYDYGSARKECWSKFKILKLKTGMLKMSLYRNVCRYAIDLKAKTFWVNHIYSDYYYLFI